MAKCKGCGADILWIRTPYGKLHPCDPKPVVYWAKQKGKGKVVTPNGEVVSCEFKGELDKATGYGYVSHWSTCPEAGSFKRRR